MGSKSVHDGFFTLKSSTTSGSIDLQIEKTSSKSDLKKIPTIIMYVLQEIRKHDNVYDVVYFSKEPKNGTTLVNQVSYQGSK